MITFDCYDYIRLPWLYSIVEITFDCYDYIRLLWLYSIVKITFDLLLYLIAYLHLFVFLNSFLSI